VRPVAEASDPAARREGLKLYSRFCFFLSGVLDSFSIAFFCFPFSVIAHALSSVWCRFVAEE
jgi:hypothetical protein